MDNKLVFRISAEFAELLDGFAKVKKTFKDAGDSIEQVEAKFTKSFSKIESEIRIFGKTSETTRASMAALKTAMVNLVNAGVDPLDASIIKMKRDYDALNASLGNGSSNMKKSNMQFTNLALVIQDLPYGFRGIQNNLPALFGSIAGGAGIAYLAFSSIVAALTFWDQRAQAAAAATKKLKDENDALVSSVSGEATKVATLIEILKSESETRERKNRAIKELQTINPDIFKGLKLEGDGVKNLNKFYSAYINNLKNVILLKQAEQELEQLIKQELKSGPVLKRIDPKPLKDSNKLLTDNLNVVSKTEKAYTAIDGKNTNIINNLNKENKQQAKKKDLLSRISKLTGSIELKQEGGGKSPEQIAKDNADALLKAQNVQVQNYIDTLDDRNKEITKSELQLQEDIVTLAKAGFTNYESAFLANKARIDDINSKYNDIEYKRNQKSINDNIAFENQLAKDLDRIDKERLKQEQDNYNASLSYLKQYYNNKRDFATGSKEELKNIAMEEQATLDSLFLGGAINYEDYLKLSADSTAKFVSLTEQITKNAFDSMLKIGNGIMSALGPSLDLLLEKGADVGEVLSNAFKSVLKQLAKVIISAAIAVALISILFPKKLETAGGSGKLFGGLFGQGMGLGSTLFGGASPTTLTIPSGGAVPQPTANGGIFGGPSYRLVGEYPGAKSNPEVVAPLDKLKGLMGTGTGTLEARISGNDLLILMNKAQRNNNLSY